MGVLLGGVGVGYGCGREELVEAVGREELRQIRIVFGEH